MKLAILSDIHSNLPALERALDAVDKAGVDAVYCLGDVVGYGADPAPCVDLVRERCDGAVLGNHDEAVATGRSMEMLPSSARAAISHNRDLLSEDQITWLAGLPLMLELSNCTFVHASPRDPERWNRLLSFAQAREQFDYFGTDVCFIGHTHMPAVMSDRIGVLRVREGARYLVNVGSVGQPRDGNPRLGLAFFDTEAFELDQVRLPYDVQRAAERIREEGLPGKLARRLEKGE